MLRNRAVVAAESFVEREPGTVAQCFSPAMMNVRAIDSPGWSWFRIWVHPCLLRTANGSVDVEPQSLAAGARLRLLDGKRRWTAFAPPPGGTEYASIFRIVARLPRYGTPRGTGKADVPKTVVLGTPKMATQPL